MERFLAIKGKRRDVIQQLRDLFRSDEINSVNQISEHLYALGYTDDHVALDLSIARGLAYYTGPVFEAILLDAPQFGSIFAGGRYDNLVMRFLGERIPAVGASIGVDRLLAALAHVGAIAKEKATARVLIANMDPALANEYLEMTWELRRADIPTEFYIGTAKGPGKQLKYADQYEIPVVLLYGTNEKEQGIVTIKDMTVGREKTKAVGDRKEWLAARPGQTTAKRGELIEAVRKLLAEIDRG
jgi:histidyl-tRNA synthetase